PSLAAGDADDAADLPRHALTCGAGELVAEKGINRVDETRWGKKVKRDKSVRSARRPKVPGGEVLADVRGVVLPYRGTLGRLEVHRLVRVAGVGPELGADPGEHVVGFPRAGHSRGAGLHDRIVGADHDLGV